MALRPPQMDQCRFKFRCRTGPNNGLAYDGSQPCEDGFVFIESACDCSPNTCGAVCSGSMAITLTSSLSYSNFGASVVTFYPVTTVEPGALVRVMGQDIQAFNSCTNQFESVGTAPYDVGDIHDGKEIIEVFHRASLGDCSEP